MSSLAQEESRSISENTTWGQRKRFADGKFSVPFSNFLGYDRGDDGSLVINEGQAKIVRLIYRLFLEGLSPYSIAKELTRRGIKTPAGKDIWSGTTVKSILTNEKMKGCALLQKKFTVDFLTKKQKKNEGQVPQYYVENSHEAIIDPKVFDMVQMELEKRCRGGHSGVSIFSGKIRCGDCSGIYGAKVWHSTDKYRRVIYQCNDKFKNNCKTPHITEDKIKSAFIKAVNILLNGKCELLTGIQQICDTILDTAKLQKKKRELSAEMNVIVRMTKSCIAENATIAQDQAEYQKRYDDLVKRYNAVKIQCDETERSIFEKQARKAALDEFINQVENTNTPITEFDTSLWAELLDFITVYNKDKICVRFRDGTEITVS